MSKSPPGGIALVARAGCPGYHGFLGPGPRARGARLGSGENATREDHRYPDDPRGSLARRPRRCHIHGMRGLCWVAAASLLAACGGDPHSGVLTSADNTLAPTGDAALGGPVDGIACDTAEQLLFHVHAHLAIFVGDEPRLLPAGIGIGPPLEVANGFVTGGSCFSWLHTHDQTGIIHIESPVDRAFTLGNFFDIWGQPLSATAIGPVPGPITAFVDGQPFTGDPATIPLEAHGLLQIDAGSPVHPFEPYTFSAGY